MKPRRLESETIVSSSATAGATSSGATSLGSVVGRVTGGASERASGPGMAGREDWGPDASRARSIPTGQGLTAGHPAVLFGRSTDIGRLTDSPDSGGMGRCVMAYEIEGRLLEVCTCNVLCPCWVGEDPDFKTCDTVIAWGIEQGTIEGVERRRADDGGLGPHPEEHPDPEVVEGRRVRRRARDQRAGRRAAQALHRTARRRDRRPRRA